jgi:hypothetical protein
MDSIQKHSMPHSMPDSKPTSIDRQAQRPSAKRELAFDASSPLTEEDSHREHRAALEATLFRVSGVDEELVLMLDGGELRFPPRTR